MNKNTEIFMFHFNSFPIKAIIIDNELKEFLFEDSLRIKKTIKLLEAFIIAYKEKIT